MSHRDEIGRSPLASRFMTFYDKNDSTYVHHWKCLLKQWDIERPGVKTEFWWIEDPQRISDSDPKYLCNLCHHINFKLLFHELDLPLSSCSDNCICINLGRLVHTLQRPQCAFCRLIIWKVSQKSKVSQQPSNVDDHDTSVRLSVITAGSSNTPRLRTRLSHPLSSANEDYFLQEIGKEPGQGRIVSKLMDRSLLRSWIELCELNHKKFEYAGYVSTEDLDFIDARDRCIVR